MEDSAHFVDMLREREIRPEWVERTVQEPDLREDHPDGTRHLARRIPEFEGR